MRAPRSWPGLLGALLLANVPGPAAAQAVGSEFQINTYTRSSQLLADWGTALVASDASGNFVAVWESVGQDGSSYGVFGQRYDSAGVPLGPEFQVNSFTTGGQQNPSVAAAADGNFVVVWQDAFGTYGHGLGIFGKRYDNEGQPLGSEFRVNSYTPTTGDQRWPSVAADAAGNLVVVWGSRFQDGSEFGVFGQRFDSAGAPQGDEFRVNTYTTGSQIAPAVASDASGDFVVVWDSFGQDGSIRGIHGQRYDSTGEALGSEFQVNSYTTGYQVIPSVASDASGNFVVTWESHGQDGSSLGSFGQRYDSEGVAQGGEFQVNSHTPGVQRFPSVASDASGNFVVAWQSNQDGNGYGIFGQRYDSAGVAQGGEFQINSFTTRDQRRAVVRATGLDQFVVVWQSDTQDGAAWGVFGQRFDFGATTIVSPNANVR